MKKFKIQIFGISPKMDEIVEMRSAEDERFEEANANDSIRFVQLSVEDVRDEIANEPTKEEEFRPDFTHQIFGENETIEKFELGLRVVVSFDPSLRNVHVGVFDGGEDEKKKTELIEKLGPYLPADPQTDRDVFLSRVENHEIQGELMDTYSRDNERFEVRLQRLGKNCDEARRFHASVETFALFFIDGASNIDSEDSRWELLTVWQTSPCTKFVGYMTLFTFTNPTRVKCPNSIRICQAIVLPTFQRKGHGKRLFRATHAIARKRNCYQVTVEDPAPGFSRLRDCEDMSVVCETNMFTSHDACECKPLDKERLELAINKTLTTKDQIIRCYEAFILSQLDMSPSSNRDENSDMYKPFRLMVKRRLYNFVEAESSEERKKLLQEKFTTLVREYRTMRASSSSSCFASEKNKKRVLDQANRPDDAKRLCLRDDPLTSLGVTFKPN